MNYNRLFVSSKDDGKLRCVILCLRVIDLFCRYLKVFQYLIRLKRTQMELEKSWASVMHQDHMDFAQHRKDGTNGSISQQRRQGIRPMWRVREHMAFLIRNLQFYIQVKNTTIPQKGFKVGGLKPV